MKPITRELLKAIWTAAILADVAIIVLCAVSGTVFIWNEPGEPDDEM